MKINISIFSVILLILCSSSSSFAKDKSSETKRTVLNKVKIINNTGLDMAYVIISDSENSDNVYNIKAKQKDYYHAKATGDMIATIKIGECKRYDPITGLCLTFDEKSLKNCVDEARYDFYKIKSVRIISSEECVVKCNDNGKKSCRVK